MPRVPTARWDAEGYLDSPRRLSGYLEAAFEDGDPALIAASLGDIARAKGMTRLAREAGLGRESLYNGLSPGGNPEVSTVLRVDEALTRLAALNPRLSQVVEYRFFGGMTGEETAEALGVTSRTVRRDWIKAKGWLATMRGDA